jgi:hypothetical protein
MFSKLSGRVAPIILLVGSGLWMAAVVVPLIYSLLFPQADTQQIVRALEGKATLPHELMPLGEITNSLGQLKWSVQVAAYWEGSAEYRAGKLRTTKIVELSYLAQFDKRRKPTILILTRTQFDDSQIRFDLNEGSPWGTVRSYFIPAAALAFSIYWFAQRRRLPDKPTTRTGGPPS